MSVYKYFKKLDTSYVFPRTSIVSEFVDRAFGALNVLYESLFDATAGGTQSLAGHDHADNGGIPLPMNSQLTSDVFSTYIYEFSKSAGGSEDLFKAGPFYVSPGIASAKADRFQEIAIAWKSNGVGSWTIHAGIGDPVPLDAEDGGSGKYGWVMVPRAITKDGSWENLYIFAKPTDNQASPGGETTTQTLRIQCINLVETYQSSAPLRGSRRIVSTPSTAQTILRYFEAMNTALSVPDYFFDSYIMKTIYSAANFLFEGCMDESAPGATSQSVIGHNHSGYGGLKVPCGKIYSVGDSQNVLHQCDATLASTWYDADNNNTYDRTSALGYLFKAYCSPGMNTASNTNYLTGWIKVDWDAGGAVINSRVYNNTTTSASSSTVLTKGNWTFIDDIPCYPGWNTFKLQYYSDTGSVNIDTYQIVISEAYSYDGTDYAKITSAATRRASGVRSGLEKTRV